MYEEAIMHAERPSFKNEIRFGDVLQTITVAGSILGGFLYFTSVISTFTAENAVRDQKIIVMQEQIRSMDSLLQTASKSADISADRLTGIGDSIRSIRDSQQKIFERLNDQSGQLSDVRIRLQGIKQSQLDGVK